MTMTTEAATLMKDKLHTLTMQYFKVATLIRGTVKRLIKSTLEKENTDVKSTLETLVALLS